MQIFFNFGELNVSTGKIIYYCTYCIHYKFVRFVRKITPRDDNFLNGIRK